jgi:hypothetical protein
VEAGGNLYLSKGITKRSEVADTRGSTATVLLSIQPIKLGDALTLDKLIASKIHHITGFPYNPTTDILTLPIDLHGLDYLSLARINVRIVTEGLWRDLNHHVSAY